MVNQSIGRWSSPAFARVSDIGMTIQCDEEGKLQIQHWPPLPIDDTVAISQILEVRI